MAKKPKAAPKPKAAKPAAPAKPAELEQAVLLRTAEFLRAREANPAAAIDPAALQDLDLVLRHATSEVLKARAGGVGSAGGPPPTGLPGVAPVDLPGLLEQYGTAKAGAKMSLAPIPWDRLLETILPIFLEWLRAR